MELKLSIGVMLLWLTVFYQQMVFSADKKSSQLLLHLYSGSGSGEVIWMFSGDNKAKFSQRNSHYKSGFQVLKSRRLTCRFSIRLHCWCAAKIVVINRRPTRSAPFLLQRGKFKNALSRLADIIKPTIRVIQHV